MSTNIYPPKIDALLAPLLASLPAAAVSPQPPTALLPLLSPILRQRVQLLSASTADPWLPLLCYDDSKASKLEQVVRNDRLEAHPVSGEVEVDWESEVELQYKRVDEETLQALANLRDLALSVRLVWCVGDELGGGDGWRIGEVSVLDLEDHARWGEESIPTAESLFVKQRGSISRDNLLNVVNKPLYKEDNGAEEGEDDDDDYWNQYDNTPAHTPAPKHSPQPLASREQNGNENGADEDSYYAQYATVQPAMDNHDPDEAASNGPVESSLGTSDELPSSFRHTLASEPLPESPSNPWSSEDSSALINVGEYVEVAQPRPGSSTGSSGSDTVAKLERRVQAREQSETGIKQHIGYSIKSLYRLAKVGGIDREEFERLVRTELDCLGLMDDDA